MSISQGHSPAVRQALDRAAANLNEVEVEWKGSAGPCSVCEFGSSAGSRFHSDCLHPAARRAVFDPVAGGLDWHDKSQRQMRLGGLCGIAGDLFVPASGRTLAARWLAEWWWLGFVLGAPSLVLAVVFWVTP